MHKRGWFGDFKLASRFALRELRGGLAGFRIFLACIALGTAAIGSVNTIADGIEGSIARQGQSILAGDLGFELVQREATPDEMKRIEALGTVSKSIGLRSMALKTDGSDQSLVELKSVDQTYPLFVKSATEDASFGLSKQSIVNDADELVEQVQSLFDETKTDALVEEYIVGREFYVGVLGNNRITTLPIWELLMTKLPKGEPNIATEQVKWDYAYQKKLGVKTEAATDLSKEMSAKIIRLCKRIY